MATTLQLLEPAVDPGAAVEVLNIELDNSTGSGRRYRNLFVIRKDDAEYFFDLGARCTEAAGSFRIEEITADFEEASSGVVPGLLAGWNAIGLQTVERGDAIVAVNGARDPAAMRDELYSTKPLTIQVSCCRPRPARCARPVALPEGEVPTSVRQVRQRLAAARGVSPQLLLLSRAGGGQLEDASSLVGGPLHLTDLSPLLPGARLELGQAVRRVDVERRGLGLSQLRDLVAFIRERCSPDGTIAGWFEADKQSVQYGQPLNYKAFDFYQMRQWVSGPATEAQGCSYVELVAAEPAAQAPAWFVSHAWAGSLASFWACLECQAKARILPPSGAYWVGAFALSGAELGATGPGMSGMQRAVKGCTGFLLALDEDGAAFSRLWCCAEVFLALTDREAPTLFDVSTAHARGASVLADGLVEEDGPGGSAWMRKISREAAFPIERIRKSLTIDIDTALLTNDSEKPRLLASLSSHTCPPGVLNRQLRAAFAMAVWRQAVGKQFDLFRSELMKVVGDYVEQRHMQLNFAGCSDYVTDSHVQEFAGVFAPSLQSLDLGLYACTQVTNGGLIALGSSLPKSLERLRLDFSWCQGIGDWGVRGLSRGIPRGLKQLALSFEDCHMIGNEGVSWLTEMLPPTLTMLDLNFWNCPRVDDKGVVQLAADLPASLVSLRLTFMCASMSAQGQNGGITDYGLVTLAKALPSGLDELSLAFIFCDGITSDGAEEFVAALPKGLKQISFDFRGCNKISMAMHKTLLGFFGAVQPEPFLKGWGSSPERSAGGVAKAPIGSGGGHEISPAEQGRRVIDMFRAVDVASSGTIKRDHLLGLLKLLHPALADRQFDLLLCAAGLPLADTVPYEKLLAWLYSGG